MCLDAVQGESRMNSRPGIIMIVGAVLLFAAAAGVSASGPQNGWLAELDIGLWTAGSDVGSQVSSTGVNCSYSGSGFTGGLTFGRWVSEGTLLTMTFSGLDVGSESTVQSCTVAAKTSVVSRIQMGANYYLPRMGHGFRPYISLAAGPIVAYEGRTEAGTTVIAESRSEVAFGLRPGLGFDVPVSRTVLVGMGAGMNLMTDFDNPVNGRTNYSGGEFQMRIGWMFGAPARLRPRPV